MSATDGSAIIERAIAQARQAGADAVDAAMAESDSLEARVRGDVTDTVVQSRERALGIRALVGGPSGMRTAITSTSDLSIEAVDRMAAEAVKLARATAVDPSAGLPESGFAEDWQALDLGLAAPEDRQIEIDTRIADAQAAESAARGRDPRITNSEGSSVGSNFNHIVYGNSHGFLGEYDTSSHSLFSEPIASDTDGGMQRDYWMTVGRRLSELEAPTRVGERAADRALRRLGARPVETCEVPVIFDGMTAPSLLSQIAGCVSGYSVYRQSSFLGEKLGEIVASPLITAIDDGRRPGGLGTRPFDGEGLPTRRNTVIQNGRLETFLMDTYSARKLGKQSTGNASRGTGGPPGVGATNLWIEAGDKTLEAMIAETPRGLLVTELIGMGFNPVTGDYSRGAAGLWIENGEIVHPVEEITIASNFADMLMNIDAVGSELVWLSRVASPPLRISQMTVAGAG